MDSFRRGMNILQFCPNKATTDSKDVIRNRNLIKQSLYIAPSLEASLEHKSIKNLRKNNRGGVMSVKIAHYLV